VKIVNRDLSIAVLRAFAAKRQEEHEESLLKKAARKKVSNGKENGDTQEQGASTAEGEDSKPGVSPMVEAQVSETKEKLESSPSGKIAEVAALESKIAKPLHVLEVSLLTNLWMRMSVSLSFNIYEFYLTCKRPSIHGLK